MPFSDSSSKQNLSDIVIPFFNKYSALERCLKSIEVSGYFGSRVLLVNDGSEDEVLKKVNDLCSNINLDIELISHNINRGFKESVITGIKKCSKKFVLLLNSDTIVTPNFIDMLLSVMIDNDSFKAVAPVSNHPSDLYQFRKELFNSIQNTSKENLINEIFKSSLKKYDKLFGTITVAPYLTAFCLALEMKTFQDVGYFSDDYKNGYFEDLDLSCKIRKLGFQLGIREDCFVYHQGHVTYSTKKMLEKEEIIYHNFDIYSSLWGHLPEHGDLLERMSYAGRICPI